MNHIIDKKTYVRYRIAPMKDYITSEQLKAYEVSVLKHYEEDCKKAEEFRNWYIKNGPDDGMAFVVDTRTFNIMWFMLYQKGDRVIYDYDGFKIEIGKCISCKDEIGTWYVKAEYGTVYINA